ncbi:MAG: polysaccharide pyruvyl transferase family protein [Bacteroidales bacterium]
MKIGILTITPNIGFGGIMQAYALKYILEKLGHDVQVVNYTTKVSIKDFVLFFIKSILKFTQGEYTKFFPKSEFKYKSQNVLPFIEENLNFSQKVTSKHELVQLINTSYEAVVVGSDQVWRPKYVLGIANYFFDGIDSNIKRLAYAASFGVENFEYTKEEAIKCSELLNYFSYVSVREKSGIDIVKKNLCYAGDVNCDLDPTLLVGRSAYKKFLSNKGLSKGKVFTYILDYTKKKEEVVELVSKTFDVEVYRFNTNAENPQKKLEERVAPPVEDWLNGIYSAKFVVTDSFHGCVFSILFNKPFVVYVNKNRGAERFVSILSQLDLLDRLVYDLSEFDSAILTKSIDWNKVNIYLELQRKEIANRLKIAL